MEKVKSFEDLKIWQEARLLVNDVYKIFKTKGPGTRDFGFRDQIQRASISIMNNIAEGYERDSDAEFARFLAISKGSSGEVRSMLYLTEDLNYLAVMNAKKLRAKTYELSKRIYALIKYLKRLRDTSIYLLLTKIRTCDL